MCIQFNNSIYRIHSYLLCSWNGIVEKRLQGDININNKDYYVKMLFENYSGRTIGILTCVLMSILRTSQTIVSTENNIRKTLDFYELL